MGSGGESDEIERWLNTEFESPAEEALSKVEQDARLSPYEWKTLVNFVAAQDVRTPARLAEHLRRWDETVPRILEETLKESVSRLETATKLGQVVSTTRTTNAEYIPLRVIKGIAPGQEFGIVKAEVVVGRGLWFQSMRTILAKVGMLHAHRWTILRAPDGLNWFTSDDPVVRLNYSSEGTYDFQGGWGSPGTEIFLPLSPRHLLYTKVGAQPPRRGDVVPRPQTEMIRRMIAAHAHRFIFAASPEPSVSGLRPRAVDASRFRYENEKWRRWHEEQTVAEQSLTAFRDGAA